MKWLIFLLNIILILALFFYKKSSETKIGYIVTSDLVAGYDGTQEANVKFNKFKQKMLSRVDSLSDLILKKELNFNDRLKDMSEVESSTLEDQIAVEKRYLMEYRNGISTKIELEEQKIMGGVIRQIEGFIEEYRRQNDYDFILAKDEGGLILSANKNRNITEEVLKKLNDDYR